MKKPTIAQRKRESALLIELQSDHGYTLQTDLPAKDRTGLVFNFTTQSATAVRFVRFAVPAGSALGIALKKADEPAKRARRR